MSEELRKEYENNHLNCKYLGMFGMLTQGATKWLEDQVFISRAARQAAERERIATKEAFDDQYNRCCELRARLSALEEFVKEVEKAEIIDGEYLGYIRDPVRIDIAFAKLNAGKCEEEEEKTCKWKTIKVKENGIEELEFRSECGERFYWPQRTDYCPVCKGKIIEEANLEKDFGEPETDCGGTGEKT